jgi:SAM-dependent methyltransferase
MTGESAGLIAFYDHYSERWAEYRQLRPDLDLRERKVLEMLRAGPLAGRVLDIGCGDALLGKHLCCHPGVEYVGLDVSSRTLELAAANLDDCQDYTLVQGDARTLAFGPDYFDVLIMGELIEHFQFPRLITAEARRVARPGSRAIVTTPNYASLCHRVGLLLRGRIAFDVEEHVRLFTYRSFKEFLVANGFHPRRIEGVFYFIDMPWPLLRLRSRGRPLYQRLQVLEHRLLRPFPGLAGWLVADCQIVK